MSQFKFFSAFSLLVLVSLLFIFPACSDDDDDDSTLVGNWVNLSDFEGVSRSDAVGFSIGTRGYIGTGYDGTDVLRDFWEYNPDKDTWMQKADFPGAGRLGAVGFGMDSTGYIGTGYDGLNRLKDFWEYKPTTNSWTRKADFGGSARYGAVGLAINNKGYLGTGYDGNYLKDFWQFDPIANSWVQKVSVGGSKRKDAAAFVIDGKAYIGTGINNGSYDIDFWEYSPELDSWTEKNSLTNVSDETFDDGYTSITGVSKVAFTINSKGYYATSGSGASKDIWEYNPGTDRWIQKTYFEGSSRTEATGFVIGNRGYITTGRNSSSYYDDIWGFDPEETYNEYD
jgi:N-acetylneuraminic acid mutarotase